MIFDIFTCIILLFDFLKGLLKSDNRKEYFKRNWLELLAAIPFDIILSPILPLRYLNIVRLLRILILIGEYFKIIGDFLKNTRLDEILAILIIVVIGSTLSLYLVDPTMNNLFNDLWFVIVSITTVGYGDVIPNTLYGKMISLILLVIGVFIFSAITGAFSTYFTDNLLQEGTYHIKELNNKIDANEVKIDDINNQLLKNEEKIDELKNEIKELKQIIQDNNK